MPHDVDRSSIRSSEDECREGLLDCKRRKAPQTWTGADDDNDVDDVPDG